MDRTAWHQIRDRIAAEIASGRLPQGARLPVEGALCERFGAGRHSVRRAVQALAIEGKLRVEQGRGTFVAARPRLTYRIGRRTRFRDNLLAQGMAAVSEVMSVETCAAPADVAAFLNLAEGAPAFRSVRRGLGDGVPLTLSVSWHDAARLPDFAGMAAQGFGNTRIYAGHGITDYLRRSTIVSTRIPDATEAALLRMHPATPVLVVGKVDVLPDGTPLGWSEGIWSGGIVQIGIDFDGDGDDNHCGARAGDDGDAPVTPSVHSTLQGTAP